jgi:hypothetical protein
VEPSFLLSSGNGFLSLGVERPKREANHSPAFSADVQNA